MLYQARWRRNKTGRHHPAGGHVNSDGNMGGVEFGYLMYVFQQTSLLPEGLKFSLSLSHQKCISCLFKGAAHET